MRAPQSPMKIRAGWTFQGRNPRQTPSVITATSGPTLPGGEHADVVEPERVEEERPRGDGGDAGGQPVEAVDEVDGVGHADDPAAR